MSAQLSQLNPRWRDWLVLIALSALYTFLNALKPMQIDDTAYAYFAKQIASHPFDPYGFQVFWYQEPEPAMQVLAPPVSLYWNSLAVRLFGECPLLWKLWQFPFSFLFVASLYFLSRRFAPGYQMLIVVMTCFSPTFLPSLNLMLDIPALALGLGALAFIIKACNSHSAALASLGGILAGLAIETKYTGALAALGLLLYALIFKRACLGVLACTVATILFVGWESLVACGYGESHFLFHVRAQENSILSKLQLGFPLVAMLGGLTPAFGLFGMTALGARPKTVVLLSGMVLFGFFLLATIPESHAAASWHFHQYSGKVSLNNIIFAVFGVVVGLTTLATAGTLCRLPGSAFSLSPSWRKHPAEWFLLSWLLLEVAGYFVLTPFPAARRTMGITVVGVLLGGRLASRSCRSPARRALLRHIALGGVALGFGYYALDFRDAYVQKRIVADAHELIHAHGEGTIWYVGHWGLQYYAETAGMQPVVPARSQLNQVDWLVVPERSINQQQIELDRLAVTLLRTLTIDDPIPLRTVSCYYGGHSPLEHREGPRLAVHIYRVRVAFTPPAKQ